MFSFILGSSMEKDKIWFSFHFDLLSLGLWFKVF